MRHLTIAALVALTTMSAASEAQARSRGHGGVPAIVSQEAARAGVPQHLAHAVIRKESGYNCRAKNPRSTASGAGQLTRGTARALGVTNVFDCHQNIAAAMRYLRAAINRGGAGCAGVALYNRGVGAAPICTAYGRQVMRLASN